MMSQVIERCGWPFPGEAPGKEELDSRMKEEPSSTNYHL